MDCTKLAEIFAGENENDLDAAASAAFDDHLNGCQTCLDRLAEAEGELEGLTDWEAPQISDEAWAKVKTGIDAEIASPAPIRIGPPRSRMPLFLAAAAAILFLAGLGFLLITPRQNGKTNGTAFISTQDQSPPNVSAPGGMSPSATADAEVISVKAGEGYTAEIVDIDGVPCVVVEETH